MLLQVLKVKILYFVKESIKQLANQKIENRASLQTIMIIYFLYIITGFTGFLILFIINTKYRNLSQVNKYLQITIGFAALRFVLNGAAPFYNTTVFNTIIATFSTLTIITIPCFYLYVKDLVKETTSVKQNSKHFYTPAILIILYILANLSSHEYVMIWNDIFIFCFFSIGVFYIVIGYIFLNKNVWSRKTEFKSFKAHERIIYYWTLTLFVCACLLIVRLGMGVIINKYFLSKIQLRAMWVGSVIWLSLFLKLLTTPEILYGFNILSKKIEEFKSPDFVLNIIWSLSPTIEISNIKDQKLTEKILPFLKQHLHRIEEITLRNHLLRNPLAGIEELAKETKVPISHVTYLFKYHCKESFSDFKKIVRIQDAINFLKNSYLATHTLESLAVEVGFTSYTSFFLSFKDITGMSPLEYVGKGK